MLALRLGQVDIHGVILGAKDELGLLFVENGILRNFREWLLIFVNGLDIFRFIVIVKLEKLIILEEKEGIGVVSVELELHTGVSELPVSEFFNLKFAVGALLVDGNLGDLELIFDQFLSDSNTNLLLILGNTLVEDLDTLVAIWNLPLLSDDAEILVVVDHDVLLVGHHIGVDRWKVLAESTLVIFGIGVDLEVVVVFTSVDLEARLISLICDSESNSGTKHHLGALHGVIHDIL